FCNGNLWRCACERSRRDFDALSSNAERLCKTDECLLLRLARAKKLRACCSKLGIGTGSVGSGTKLVIDEHMNRLRQSLAAINIGFRRKRQLLCRSRFEKGIGSIGFNLQFGDFQLRFGAMLSGASNVHVSSAKSKIERLPREQSSSSHVPSASTGTVRKNNAGERRQHVLRKQLTSNVVVRAAIRLPHHVGVRKVISPREFHPGLSCDQLLRRRASLRIMRKRKFHSLPQREGRGSRRARRLLADEINRCKNEQPKDSSSKLLHPFLPARLFPVREY